LEHDKLYKKLTAVFDNGRELNIRLIKFPTFIKENRILYYAVFLCDIEFYKKYEIKIIHKICRELIRQEEIDSYTIFLVGKLKEHIDKYKDNPLGRYNTFIINRNPENFSFKNISTILKNIQGFFDVRLLKIFSEQRFGQVERDAKRLSGFIETLNPASINRMLIELNRNSINNTINTINRSGETLILKNLREGIK